MPIEQKRIERGEMRIVKNLTSLGFTLGKRSSIPVEYTNFYLPIRESEAPKNTENILNTIHVMKSWDEKATGIIAGIGIGFKNMQDLTPINSFVLDVGGWEYLFQLGKKKNISKKSIKKAVVQFALDHSNKNAQATLDTLISVADIPSWIDAEKSTQIEKLAASFATNNKDASKKIKKYNEAEGSKYIKAAASIDKRNSEIAIEVSFKPWDWVIPILKTLSFVRIYHEIAHKISMGVVDEGQNMYKTGPIRNSSEERSVNTIFSRFLENKKQEVNSSKKET